MVGCHCMVQIDGFGHYQVTLTHTHTHIQCTRTNHCDCSSLECFGQQKETIGYIYIYVAIVLELQTERTTRKISKSLN